MISLMIRQPFSGDCIVLCHYLLHVIVSCAALSLTPSVVPLSCAANSDRLNCPVKPGELTPAPGDTDKKSYTMGRTRPIIHLKWEVLFSAKSFEQYHLTTVSAFCWNICERRRNIHKVLRDEFGRWMHTWGFWRANDKCSLFWWTSASVFSPSCDQFLSLCDTFDTHSL